MIRAAVEETTDYTLTARLATEAFDLARASFDPDHLRWLYEDCFSRGATVVGLIDDDGRKVGQIALQHQAVSVDGKPETAAGLIDLFIAKQWRGRERVQMLYDEVGHHFARQGIRFAFGVPNAKAAPVNERFFQLKPCLRMELRMGLALPFAAPATTGSEAFDRTRHNHFISLFDRYATDNAETGLSWTGEGLFHRLCGIKHKYAVHTTKDLLLISSPRKTRGISHTLLCAYLRRTGGTPPKRDASRLAHAAVAWWKRPLFVYAGINRTLAALPGMRLPDKWRPSPLMLQMRDFAPQRGRLDIDRFQLIDFDFA